MDFKDSIRLHSNTFLYLDPPYLLNQALYGKNGNTHKGFDHTGLAEILRSRDKWLLSYNNSPGVLSMYKDYRRIYPEWKYGMSADKNSREVLILSNDLPGPTL